MRENGWEVFLITGRNYTFAEPLLKNLDFPYLLGLQNGALFLSMPSQKIQLRKYLPFEVMLKLHKQFILHDLEFVVEGGIERGDICFFRNERFSADEVAYFRFRESMSKAKWQAIRDFAEIGPADVPLLKCFGSQEDLMAVRSEIKHKVHMPIVRDPFRDSYVSLTTDEEATKGCTLQTLLSKNKPYDEVVVCGDDLNDEPMLRLATKKVIMATAPQELLELADIIVPPAQENGILEVL